MAATVKVAGCPGTTIISESGWLVITGGSTAEGGREERTERGRERGGREGEREGEGGIEGSMDRRREGGSSSTTAAFYCHMKQNLSSHSFNNAIFWQAVTLAYSEMKSTWYLVP